MSAAPSTVPTYGAADIAAVLLVSVGVLLGLVLLYLVILWVLGGSDAYEEVGR